MYLSDGYEKYTINQFMLGREHAMMQENESVFL